MAAHPKIYSWFRNWLLCNIEHIHLHNCQKLEQLPVLGELPSLKYLKIDGLEGVKHVTRDMYGSGVPFPSLEVLTLSYMIKCEKWDGLEEGQSFRHLRALWIMHCPKLKEFPSIPSTMELIRIRHVLWWKLIFYDTNCYSEDRRLQNLTIWSVLVKRKLL